MRCCDHLTRWIDLIVAFALGREACRRGIAEELASRRIALALAPAWRAGWRWQARREPCRRRFADG